MDPFRPSAEGVTVVVPAHPGITSTVEELLSALDEVAEPHHVVVVGGPPEPADRHPGRVTVVPRETASDRAALIARVGVRHRRVFLPGRAPSAAGLPAMLALARAERADVVVGHPPVPTSARARWEAAWLALVGADRRDVDGGKLVDARALADVPPGTSDAALPAELRRRGARVLHHPVGGAVDRRPGHVSRVWADLVRTGPLGRLARRLRHPRDPVFAAVLLVAVALSVTAWAVVAARQATLAYPDAVSHLLISRRVVDAPTPGAAQLGGVWLPLTHVLALPLVLVESWYHAGVAPSLVSMCGYVAAVGWLYRIAVGLTGRRAAGVTAAVVFGANPDVLYLQSTPMTELPLLACVAGATWYLLRWCREGRCRHLAATAFAVLGATLVRYEGWVFLAAVALVVAVRSWRRTHPVPWARVRAEALFFGIPAVGGVALWSAWNAAIFGDPLNFLRGEFAKPALWVGADERAVGDWGVSLWTYLLAMNHDLGPLVLLLGAAGAVAFAWRTRLRDGAAALLPLLVFLPFFVWALHSGQRPLHVPELGGDFYNVRFALVMALPAAVFTGYLAVRPIRPSLRLLPAAVVALACAEPLTSTPATPAEARAFRAGGAERVNAEAAAWLRAHYDGGRVLMQSWSNETVVFDSRVPTDEVVYEGSYRQWEPALADPAGHGIRWVHLRRTPGGEDRVWQRLHDNPALLDRYALVYRDEHHEFHRRVDTDRARPPAPRGGDAP